MGADYGLSDKQKAFADEYMINGGSAEQAALAAGYSKSYARSRAYKIAANIGVQAYIRDRAKGLAKESEKKEKKTIAKQEDVLAYLTSVMNGQETEEVLRLDGKGRQVKDDIAVSAKDRIRAAELLGKYHGAWTEKLDVQGDVAVTFVDDVPLSDDE